MAQEIAEVPDGAERLLSNGSTVANIAKRIAAFAPRLVVLCGRGSSGHVGVYLRYLFETKLGLLTSAAAPSGTSAISCAIALGACLVMARRDVGDCEAQIAVVTGKSG